MLLVSGRGRIDKTQKEVAILKQRLWDAAKKAQDGGRCQHRWAEDVNQTLM